MFKMGGIVSKNAFLPPPPTPIYTRPDLKFVSTKNHYKIPVLFIKNRDANFTFLFSHGNAEDVGAAERWLYTLSDELKVNIAAYDYPGYGESSSENGLPIQPSEELCYEAADSVYDYLTREENIQPSQLIAYGRSLGTGVTVDLASRKKFAGVILQSPLRSAVRVVLNTPFTLPIDIFANQDKIQKIHAPIYIFHGKMDTVINYSHGVYLHSLLNPKYAHKPWWIEGAGHNDIEAGHMDEYIKRLQEYIQSLSTPK